MISGVPARTRLDDGIFSPRLRRAGILWAVLTVPLAALGGSFLHGEQQYLIGWTLASGLYTTPALVVTWLVVKRAPNADRSFWRLMLAGLVFVYGIGLSVLVLETTEWDPLRRGGAVAVCVAMVAYGVGLIVLLRSRSGHRALSLDVVETAISAVAIVSAVPLLVGESVLTAEAAWFAVPSALATMAMICASLWSLTLLARLGSERTSMEIMGACLALIGAIQAALQVAEGVSDFTLPQGPVIGLQALCMALVLLAPLHASHTRSIGLDLLPPQAQVRNGGVVAMVTIAALPVVLIETLVLAPTKAWAIPYAAAVAATLLLLSTLRHLLAVQETKRLYAQVEQAAEERRILLARVMQGADHDRHRVAAQLHEQAASAYAAFVSFIHATTDPREGVPSHIAGASVRVRDDLSRQAESLRQLMLAIRPLEVAPTASSDRLSAPITAYIDSLYGDAPSPALIIDVDPDLVLEWNTETILLRIVQEAIRNVWQHARAATLRVAVRLVDDDIEVRIDDDGVGFDPDHILFESGLEAIRTFAGLTGGSMDVTSAPGAGTTCLVRLGSGGPATLPDVEPARDHERSADEPAGPSMEESPVTPASTTRRLRLVTGGAADRRLDPDGVPAEV